MVMNVLGGNVDDHNKNFSFLMKEDGEWHVAPAYDYTFSVDTEALYYVNRHGMTINNKTEDITSEDMLEIARKYGVKSAESFIRKAVGMVLNYAEYGRKAGVGKEWIEIIEMKFRHVWGLRMRASDKVHALKNINFVMNDRNNHYICIEIMIVVMKYSRKLYK